MIAADLRKRRLKPHTTWHLDEVYLKNRRPNGLPLPGRRRRRRGPRGAGPVQRNKHAALKRMRKLLKKSAFAPERLVTDDLRSYSSAAQDLGSNAGMSADDGRTIELRIRISRRGGGNARCSGSRARGQPRNFFPHTPPSTTPSTPNATSSPPPPTACFALRRWPRDGPQSRRPDNY